MHYTPQSNTQGRLSVVSNLLKSSVIFWHITRSECPDVSGSPLSLQISQLGAPHWFEEGASISTMFWDFIFYHPELNSHEVGGDDQKKFMFQASSIRRCLLWPHSTPSLPFYTDYLPDLIYYICVSLFPRLTAIWHVFLSSNTNCIEPVDVSRKDDCLTSIIFSLVIVSPFLVLVFSLLVFCTGPQFSVPFSHANTSIIFLFPLAFSL